jgi:bifunctional DNA-binding transcriptional regulator/antitoxin component of YhaV-PrlF toxin-antitoxin module
MQTTVSKRGQTAIPARIRQKYNIGSQARLEWLDEAGVITVIPIPKDAISHYRGRGKGEKLVDKLLQERKKQMKFERKQDAK